MNKIESKEASNFPTKIATVQIRTFCVSVCPRKRRNLEQLKYVVAHFFTAKAVIYDLGDVQGQT